MRQDVIREKVRSIAIYDDQIDSRESLSEIVHDCGFIPELIKEPFHTVDECIKNITKYDAAVFDHRLHEGNFGTYKGAEVVTQLYGMSFPALLVSAWTEGDPEDIQIYRRNLPYVISKNDFEPDNVIEGLGICLDEFAGVYDQRRAPTRTIVRIASDYDADSRYPRVEAYISSWDPKQGITFPVEVVPEKFRDYLKLGTRFFADVNTGALSQDELFFENFEIAPEPNLETTDLLRR